MRQIFAVVMLMTLATSADAQASRRVPRVPEPASWISVGIGLFNGNDVSDGGTASTWSFGRASTPQFRASLERAINRTASIGATASYVHLPLTYIGNGGALSCARCAAHMDVIAAGASFHAGGGVGLHQVIEASAGALQYRSIRSDSDKAALGPAGGNIDPYFTFGYGFGYAFDPNTQVSIVQDFGLALHERSGLTSEQSNTLTQRTIRLNFRYGFGTRTCRNCL